MILLRRARVVYGIRFGWARSCAAASQCSWDAVKVLVLVSGKCALRRRRNGVVQKRPDFCSPSSAKYSKWKSWVVAKPRYYLTRCLLPSEWILRLGKTCVRLRGRDARIAVWSR